MRLAYTFRNFQELFRRRAHDNLYRIYIKHNRHTLKQNQCRTLHTQYIIFQHCFCKLTTLKQNIWSIVGDWE